jgi:hypothetical protein
MIEREDREWGVRLMLRPFQASLHAGMHLQAEISNPKPKRNPEIRIVFNGVPIQHPLVPVDAQTWGQALAAILAEARRVAEELKRKKACDLGLGRAQRPRKRK